MIFVIDRVARGKTAGEPCPKASICRNVDGGVEWIERPHDGAPTTGMSGRTRRRLSRELVSARKRVKAEVLHRVEDPGVAPGVAHGITNRYRRDAQRE